jgi:hypothetical protein
MTQTVHPNSLHSSDFSASLKDRMRGPGGYYNLGNIIGLIFGITLQVLYSQSRVAETAAEYLFGNASALWLTLATLIFMVSGEAYYRAWKNGFPPDANLNWWGDFLSGIGALSLGVALFLLGQPLLAATAGLLHAVGKFGSAFYVQKTELHLDWHKVFRWLVVFSRMPALGATVVALFYALGLGSFEAFGTPLTLLICYLLWLRADMLLLRG